MTNPLLSPSMLSADFMKLGADIEMINKSEADWFHLDIMDGVFVPNITFGFGIIRQMKKLAQKPFDVHLMIVEPDRYLAQFRDAGSDIITVHYEATKHLHRCIQTIKSLGMKAGVSLNPHTPVALLEDIISELDLVLIMSVNPGFGGQKFIANSIDKIKRTKDLIVRRGSNALIEVDGGVDNTNAAALCNAGADVLVAGSYIFNSENPMRTISELKMKL